MAPSEKACRLCVFLLINFAVCNGIDGTDETRTGSIADAVPKECIRLPEDSCPRQGSACPCTIASPGNKSTRDGTLLILCCHLEYAAELLSGIECASSGDESIITALHVRNSSLALNLALENASRHVSSLTSLSVTGGTVEYANGRLSDLMPNLSCLNLSNNGLANIPFEALNDLSALRALDLSANNVTQFPSLPNVTDGHPLWIDISGNGHMQCKGIQEALSQKSSLSPRGNASNSPPAIILHNKQNASCISQPDYWFKWTHRYNVEVLEFKIKMEKECPREEGYSCVCTVERLEEHVVLQTLAVSVDCSGRGLFKLPMELPKGTVSLNISHNYISSLEQLGKNRFYSGLRKLYADNNFISCIDTLEGTNFFKHLEILSIRSNKLKELPIYFLNIDKYVVQLHLGDNPYHCDCNTFHKLKPWVELYRTSIIDHNDMLCVGEELEVTKIIDLQNKEICKNKIEMAVMDPRFVTIIVELLLLICLVGKLSYDCWVYKTTNRLTWPASAMPKVICCDWIIDL